jgi:general stress protein 26
MTLFYHINSEAQTVDIRGSGATDAEALSELMQRLIHNDDFRSHYAILVDFANVSYVPSFREIRQFSSLYQTASHAFRGKVAFVVSNTAQVNAGRFASALARAIRFQMNVFGDRQHALSWIHNNPEVQMESLEKKIINVIRPFQLASLATVQSDGNPWVRYVTIRGDEDLTIRFATPLNSRKVDQLKKNPHVHLTCGATDLASANEWVQITGVAQVKTDLAIRKSFWDNFLSAYFDGPEDEAYAVVEISPSRIEYYTMESLTPQILER